MQAREKLHLKSKARAESKTRAEKGETGLIKGEREMSRKNLEIKLKLEPPTNKQTKEQR